MRGPRWTLSSAQARPGEESSDGALGEKDAMGTGDDVCDLSRRARRDRTTESYGLGREFWAHPAPSVVGPAHRRKSRQVVAVIGGDAAIQSSSVLRE
jgi:hypothetical protein